MFLSALWFVYGDGLVSGQNRHRIKEQSNTPEEGTTTTILGARVQKTNPQGEIMRGRKYKESTDSKGFDPKVVQGLARYAWRGKTGACSPSSSDSSNFK